MENKKEKYGFVYIWRDKKHKRFYIGCRWGFIEDGYICSSTWMRNAYKRRPGDFKRRILSICKTKELLWDKEFEWLLLIKKEELSKKYYNLSIFHFRTSPHKGDIHKSETKLKMSQSHKGKIRSQEHCDNLSKSLKGRSKSKHKKKREYTEEGLEKIKKSWITRINPKPMLGKKHSEETKRKIREKRALQINIKGVIKEYV